MSLFYILENNVGGTLSLPQTFIGAFGAAVSAQEGSRARGYDTVVHEGDGRATGTTLMLEGVIYGANYAACEAQFDVLGPAVKAAVKLGFGTRHWKVAGGLMLPPTYRSPVLNSFNVQLIFRLSDVRRFLSNGTPAPF